MLGLLEFGSFDHVFLALLAVGKCLLEVITYLRRCLEVGKCLLGSLDYMCLQKLLKPLDCLCLLKLWCERVSVLEVCQKCVQLTVVNTSIICSF